MDLVEREAPLAELTARLAEARGGRGSGVLVGAEAGMGKSSLARALADHARASGTTVHWGACDPLTTPRPLGPLWDMTHADPRLRQVLDLDGDRHRLFSQVLEALNAPTLLVVEDLHWADDATLDLLRYLGRRVTATRALVVVTFRDEHPPDAVRTLLGDLAGAAGTSRLRLAPLSRDAVATLIGAQPLDPEHVRRLTDGNPFYVSEVVTAPGWTVPPTVADAVLARVAPRSPAARELLGVVAESPGGLEVDLVEALVPGSGPAVTECVDTGLLVDTGTRLTFRHELARLAVRDARSPSERRSTSSRLLHLLEARGSHDESRLAHHAHVAGDRPRILRHATAAGAAASARGAHRVAAVQYALAAEQADDLPPAERAQLVALWATERAGLGDAGEVADLWRTVAGEWSAAGAPVKAAAAMVECSRAVWGTGDTRTSRRIAEDAITVLESHPPGPELALGYARLASLSMLARDTPEALRWGRKAIELAEHLGATRPLVNALNAVGAATIVGGLEPSEGIADLRRSHDLAVAAGDDTGATLGLSNTGTALGEVREYALAEPALRETIAFARARDLDDSVGYASAWLSRVLFETGRWDEAVQVADDALVLRGTTPIIAITALTVQARVLVRRGEPGHVELLDEAARLADATGDLQRQWPVAAARAEALWWAGRHDDVLATIRDALATAERLGVSWATGELALWRRRAGNHTPPPERCAEPFRLQVLGDHTAAAAAWQALGCPYERAECLGELGEEAQRDALATFDTLGAAPAADRLRSRMRAAGLAGIPPRPRATTREAPGQLTARQLEVLALVAEGRTNAAIAERLFISEKTAGHHVSAVLHKLGVSTRGEAAAQAVRLGLAPTT